MKMRGQAATATKYQTTLDQFVIWAGDRLPGDISSFEVESFLADWQERFVVKYGKQPSLDTKRNTITRYAASTAISTGSIGSWMHLVGPPGIRC
jgi:hypothetical protein